MYEWLLRVLMSDFHMVIKHAPILRLETQAPVKPQTEACISEFGVLAGFSVDLLMKTVAVRAPVSCRTPGLLLELSLEP